MSRFIEPSVQRVDLGGGDWVDLRLPVPYGVRRQIEQKLLGFLKYEIDDKGERRPVGEMQLASSNIALLMGVVMAWGGPGFTDPDGKVRPITAANLDALDYTAEQILTEIQKRTEQPTPDFMKRSSQSKGTAQKARRKSASV